MKLMIALLISGLFILFCSGCTTAPIYQKAETNGYGYSDSAVTENRHRVLFKARNLEKEKVLDLALLRAAQVTLIKGYEWFFVNNKEVIIDRYRAGLQTGLLHNTQYPVMRECGLIGCRNYPVPILLHNSVFRTGSRIREVDVTLEIHMGQGETEKQKDIYQANEVITKLGYLINTTTPP